MASFDKNKNVIEQVDKKTNELIMEFQTHYKEYIKLVPEDKDRKDEIFQSWAIQKIAGIQVSVLELAERLNSIVSKIHDH